ncbi:ABC transporter permease [Haliangium sp.]|uniref:ABC transporter permease n=1 Tax=Haliangium sp. TaxID=2663208 RepID=UPI003D136E5F
MKAFLVLTRLRLLDVLRSPSSTGFMLLFPVGLMLMTGLVFMNGHPFEQRVVVIVEAGHGADADASTALARALADYQEVTIERVAGEAEAMGKLRARMANAVLLPGPTAAPIRLVVGPRDRLFARGLGQVLPRPHALEVIDVPRWGYVHYLFPGLLTFSIVVSGLFSMGYVMVLYRQNGFLRKLATTPLPRYSFVLAQILARGALILAQVAIMVAVAVLVFGVRVHAASAAWLAVITVLGLFTFMGVGFALACLIRTADVVVDVINAVSLPLVLLSELFFPLKALPGPLAALGGALPSTEMVRLTRAVLLYEVHDAAALGPGLAVLALWAGLCFGASLWVFRWGD